MHVDGHILLLVIIAGALFVVGRKFQRMVDLWHDWRGTVASIPGKRRAARGGVGTLVKAAFVAALLFWLATNISYFL